MIKNLLKFKLDGWNLYIYNIYSQYISLGVEDDDGKGFHSLIFFNKDRELDWETGERTYNFKYPKEFKIATQKFLNLKVFI